MEDQASINSPISTLLMRGRTRTNESERPDLELEGVLSGKLGRVLESRRLPGHREVDTLTKGIN